MKFSDDFRFTRRLAGREDRFLGRGSVVLWILLSLAAGFVLATIFVVDALTLNREARTIREAVVRSLDARASTKVQVSVGPLLLGGARTLLGFLDRLPEEARLALKSVRSASVGVYRLNDDPARRFATVLARVDTAMARDGWSRLVGVLEPQQQKCVLVYTPEGMTKDGPVRICLAVCDRREFVVVSARVDAEALANLVAQHAHSVRL